VLRSLTILLSLLICGSISAQNLHSKNKKALGAYRQAQDLSRVGNIREAESLLLSAIKKDKSFDEAILLLHQLQL